jgi:hypothetical protein
LAAAFLLIVVHEPMETFTGFCVIPGGKQLATRA